MRLLPGIAALFIALALAPAAHATTKLLFFDPDANQDRLLSIVELFNGYFEEQKLDAVFEPVQSAEAFEARATSDDVHFAVVSSPYLQRGKQPLTPLLVPETSGSVFYTKLLVDTGQGAALDLRGKTLAAAVSDDLAPELLNSLKALSVRVDNTFVISVSKDVDALLAVTFNQADAALVTEASLNVVTRVNPARAAQLRVLAKSAPMLRAPLCELGKRAGSSQRKAMVKVMEDLVNHDSGRELLQVLGANKWVAFNPAYLTK